MVAIPHLSSMAVGRVGAIAYRPFGATNIPFGVKNSLVASSINANFFQRYFLLFL
jgi:hypothetical protein